MNEEHPAYPNCQECGTNDDVALSVYAGGEWVGFECEGCHTVVRELYNIDNEEGLDTVD